MARLIPIISQISRAVCRRARWRSAVSWRFLTPRRLRRPPGLPVSIFSCKLSRSTPRSRRISACAIRSRERTPQPIQPPHHQRIASPQMTERHLELGTGGCGPARTFHENLFATSHRQRIPLHIQRLIICGNTCISDPHGSVSGNSTLGPAIRRLQPRWSIQTLRPCFSSRNPRYHPHLGNARFPDRTHAPRVTTNVS